MNLIPLMQPKNSHSENEQSLDELREAFGVFNQMSEQLTQSYHLLERRVIELSGELATVSEQRMKELAEKELLADQLASLLNLMPAGVVVMDKKGTIQRANPAASELLEQNLAGKKWRQVIAKMLNPQADDGHEITLKNGRLVSLATTSLDGSGQLVLMTDMTDTRKLQQQMARQERLSAMGRMVASLAHQIRTPLSAAMLYAGNLDKPDLTEQQRMKFSGKIKSRLSHLEQQVRDMLIFVRGETRLVDSLTCQYVQDEIAQLSEAVCHSSGATLSFVNTCPDQEILCNKDSLTGALLNLVNNAIEAVAPGSAHISIEYHQTGQQVEIHIADQGPGMSQDQLDQILEPFYTTKSHGTGLGLAVVQAVARAHMGQLTVTSEPGKGSRFVLTLPVKKSAGV